MGREGVGVGGLKLFVDRPSASQAAKSSTPHHLTLPPRILLDLIRSIDKPGKPWPVPNTTCILSTRPVRASCLLLNILSPLPPETPLTVALHLRHLPKMGDRVGDPEAQEPLLASRHDDDIDGDALALAEPDLPKGSPDSEAQEGVQQADAVTLVWTKSALVLAYAFIFVNFCLTSMEQQTTANLLPFVVSDFSAHSLIPAIGIASFILSGVLRLPVAKIIDTWGRPQGLAAMVAIATVGLAMMAVCSSATTYAAAQILHAVGFSGFTYILDIIVADTSSLQDRTLAFAFAGSPAIVTNFLGPPAAQWFLRYSSWRAAFALFTVLTPLVAFPVFAILQVNANWAKKLGILKPSKSERTWSEAIWHYSVEFDGKS